MSVDDTIEVVESIELELLDELGNIKLPPNIEDLIRSTLEEDEEYIRITKGHLIEAKRNITRKHRSRSRVVFNKKVMHRKKWQLPTKAMR